MNILADFVYIIHIVLLLLTLGSIFIPKGEWIKYAILLIPLVLLDWNDYDNQCSLTSLEAKLRGNWSPGTSDKKGAPEFFRPILNNILGALGLPEVTRVEAGKLNFNIMIIVLISNIIRYNEYLGVGYDTKGVIGCIYKYFIITIVLLYMVNLNMK